MTDGLTLRQALYEDMEYFYPEFTGCTFIALVGEVAGERVGIGGALWSGEFWYAFMYYDKDNPPRARHLVRGAREALELIGKRRMKLHAVPEEGTGDAFLRHFGFEPSRGGHYIKRIV